MVAQLGCALNHRAWTARAHVLLIHVRAIGKIESLAHSRNSSWVSRKGTGPGAMNGQAADTRLGVSPMWIQALASRPFVGIAIEWLDFGTNVDACVRKEYGNDAY